VVGHHHLVRLQHRLQCRRIQRLAGITLQLGASGHRIQQRPRTTALADVERLAGLTQFAVHPDRPLEHRLQIREQTHLELVAAELRARPFEYVDRLIQRLRRIGIIAQRRLALADTVQRPRPVEVLVPRRRCVRQRLVQRQGLRRLVLRQQQPTAGTLQLCPLPRIGRFRQPVQRAARPRQITRQDQRIRQRRLHQRPESRRTLAPRLVVIPDRLLEALLPRAHVAQHLLRRTVHLGRIHPGVLQRQHRELLGTFQLPRVIERDRQVPVRLSQQVRVSRLQRHMQRLAGRPRALAELPPLRQLHRLAAVRIPVQLHRIALVQRRTVRRQRQRRVRILQSPDRRQRRACLAARILGSRRHHHRNRRCRQYRQHRRSRGFQGPLRTPVTRAASVNGG